MKLPKNVVQWYETGPEWDVFESIVRHCANRCFTLADDLKESCENSYTSDDYTARGIGEELLNDFGLE